MTTFDESCLRACMKRKAENIAVINLIQENTWKFEDSFMKISNFKSGDTGVNSNA